MPVTSDWTCDVCGTPINDSDLLADPALRRVRLNGIWAAKQQPAPASAADQDPVVGEDVLGSNDAADPEIFCGYAHASQWFSEQTY